METLRKIIKTIGIIFVALTILQLVLLITSGGGTEADAIVFFYLAPITLAVGLLLMYVGRPTRKADAAQTEEDGFKSKSVSPARVLFVVGLVIFLYIAAAWAWALFNHWLNVRPAVHT